MADDLAATLAGWRKTHLEATPGPWGSEEKHGRDIADEGWSEVRIIGPLDSPSPIAITYLTNILEADYTEADAAFIITARTAMPRLLAAVEAALKLHARQDKPVRSWDLGLRCEAHDWTKNTVRSFDAVRDCPDCSYRDRHPCVHCRCEDWPCPTVLAITAALTGAEPAVPRT